MVWKMSYKIWNSVYSKFLSNQGSSKINHRKITIASDRQYQVLGEKSVIKKTTSLIITTCIINNQYKIMEQVIWQTQMANNHPSKGIKMNTNN